MTVPPHLSPRESIHVRRGDYFVVGALAGEPPIQTGSTYVEWEVRADSAVDVVPVVLVHGGGGQATDWKDTPDGRPGWADRLVRAGYAVYNVDRPGHGRSSRSVPGGDAVLPPLDYAFGCWLWAPSDGAERHTAWPWGRTPGSPELDQLLASAGTIRADFAGTQLIDAARLESVLEQTGPAVLISHSAGAPGVWIVAARRPDLVRAIVAVEPMGPAFAELGDGQRMRWGIAHAPIPFDPPVSDPDELDGRARRIQGLVGVPVAVVYGELGPFHEAAMSIAAFLDSAGAAVDAVHLPDHGVLGNGHGLIFEANSDDTLAPVLAWMQRVV